MRIVRSNLIDCFGTGAKYFHPYHFPYEKEERYYEDDKDTRTDFGFISIPPLICRNLEANKIVPVDWRNWMSQESGDFEAFFMLGLPTELMKKQLAEPGSRNEPRFPHSGHDPSSELDPFETHNFAYPFPPLARKIEAEIRRIKAEQGQEPPDLHSPP